MVYYTPLSWCIWPPPLWIFLPIAWTKSVSVEELISDDPLGLLDGDDEADSIYTLSHVKPSERLHPDYIAHRKVCKDFDLYEDAFQRIHDDLEHGRRRLVEFKEGDLHESCYYVLRGVVLYLEQNLAVKQKIEYKSGAKVRREGRTRCIFDNGRNPPCSIVLLVRLSNLMAFV